MMNKLQQLIKHEQCHIILQMDEIKKQSNFELSHIFSGWQLFQCPLFVEIRTFVTWIKSTLLLKIKCFDTHIYMKTQCSQTNKTQHYLGKENAWVAGEVRDRDTVGVN